MPRELTVSDLVDIEAKAGYTSPTVTLDREVYEALVAAYIPYGFDRGGRMVQLAK